MDGWGHLFARDKLQFYPDLNAGMAVAADRASLEVLEPYEAHLAAHGVAQNAGPIAAFFSTVSEVELSIWRDWRGEFSDLCSERWEKIKAHHRLGGWVIS